MAELLSAQLEKCSIGRTFENCNENRGNEYARYDESLIGCLIVANNKFREHTENISGQSQQNTSPQSRAPL